MIIHAREILVRIPAELKDRLAQTNPHECASGWSTLRFGAPWLSFPNFSRPRNEHRAITAEALAARH